MQVRIAAIDAPERRQRFGPEARSRLTLLCWQQRAHITPLEKDKYGRTVAQVSCQGQDVASTQLRAGLAWVYTPYAHGFEYLQPLQAQARMEHRGLWVQTRPQPPWSYRQRYGRGH
ncbi:thermonuclease family protein [Acidovorax sp. HDW3]|nr:thermonuclease family protein [Acidovorax sp. HDW3]